MILDSEYRQFLVLEPLNGLVVEVDMGHLEIRCSGDTLFVAGHRKPVILRGYQDLSGFEVLNRMVPATVPIRHFRGRGAVRQT